jgi:uncharacterized repeat protein (TIGR01451 family)
MPTARHRLPLLVAASLLLTPRAEADQYGFAALFAPVAHHRFTAPATLRLFAMGKDPVPPDYWNCVKVEFLVDGVVAATETEGEYANYQTTIADVPAGTHVLHARSYDHDGTIHDSEDVTIFVDPPLPDGPVFNLAADLVLSGAQDLEIAGTAEQPAKVIGNGHQILSAPGWSGTLTIRHAELRGLGATAVRALDVLAAGAGAVVIEDSLFERTGVVQVGADDQAQATLRRNTFSSNMLMTLTQQPFDCDPAVRLVGDSSAAKLFQGNRVGIGWAEFLNTRNWLVGGDTDADTNVVIAARGGIQVLGSLGMVMRGNYSGSRYLGGWSQGLNFELPDSAGILVEHNVVRGSSWPVRSLDGEFRYNLVTNPGHSWLQHPAAAANIHHNVLISENENQTEQGLWVLYGNQGIRFVNNTVDAGAPGVGWFGHGVNVQDGGATVSSNAFTRFPASDATNPVVVGTGGDYNLFYSPESDAPRNYESGGAGPHDAGGGLPDAQVDPLFAGPRPIPVPIAEDAVWERTLKVSQILGLVRDAYEPAAGSPLTDAGDPAGDPGNDIGAIGSGAASPLDRFGHFPVVLPSADLSVAKTDGHATAVPGQPVSYGITVSNAGPDDVAGASVTDALPAALVNAAWACSASPGSACTPSGAGGIADTVTVLAGGTLSYTLTGTILGTATGALVNTASVAPPPGTADPAAANNSATDVDALVPPQSPPAEGELVHGYDRRHDLADQPGPSPDSDLFRVYQAPHASYEAALDGASGDLAPAGPSLDRIASDGSTVVQSSSAGIGASRSLRWIHSGSLPRADEYVRVASNGCPGGCDAADVYRLRFYETTGFVPRFNNSASQITVLVLQNLGGDGLDAEVRFWAGDGADLGGVALTLGPRQSAAINTAAVLPGQGGSISVGHSGRYGQLAGKAVAVEPATGFSFDSPLSARAR